MIHNIFSIIVNLGFYYRELVGVTLLQSMDEIDTSYDGCGGITSKERKMP